MLVFAFLLPALLFHASNAASANNNTACLLPSDVGDKTCTSWSQRWYYDHGLARCLQFRYSGCGGNANNFVSLVGCNAECTGAAQKWNADKAGQRGRCFEPKIVGPCEFPTSRYFFNVDTRQCEPFQYSGCAGNYNNFATWKSCRTSCEEPDVAPTTPIAIMPWWKDTRCSGMYLKDAIALFPLMKCAQRPSIKFQYSRETGKCEQIEWYDCPHVKNMNLFEMMRECRNLCEQK